MTSQQIKSYLTIAVIDDCAEERTDLQQKERKFRAIFNNTFQFTGLLSPEGI